MPAHHRWQLALANACHSDMDDRTRHDIMRSVAHQARNPAWMSRLAWRSTSSQAEAMDMLDAWEQTPPRALPGARPWILGALFVIFLLMMGVGLRRAIIRKKKVRR